MEVKEPLPALPPLVAAVSQIDYDRENGVPVSMAGLKAIFEQHSEWKTIDLTPENTDDRWWENAGAPQVQDEGELNSKIHCKYAIANFHPSTHGGCFAPG